MMQAMVKEMQRPVVVSPPIPEGYSLVKIDDLRAVLGEAVMAVRLSWLLADATEQALVGGLLPTLRDALAEGLAARPEPPPELTIDEIIEAFDVTDPRSPPNL
jgi:hypothetical protein